jgi:low affinity Fe/Cu permease
MREAFSRFARWAADVTGSAAAFTIAVAVVLVWAVTGPLFGFSDAWQLVINTGTTVVTFWMVFLIQSAQNRDAKAVQLKLDELLKAIKGARTSLVDLESLSDEELDRLQAEFQRIRSRAESSERSRPQDAGG